MTSYITPWHHTVTHDIINYIMTSYLPIWHHNSIHDIILLIMTSYIPSWHHTFHSDINISSWRHTSHHDIIHSIIMFPGVFLLSDSLHRANVRYLQHHHDYVTNKGSLSMKNDALSRKFYDLKDPFDYYQKLSSTKFMVH